MTLIATTSPTAAPAPQRGPATVRAAVKPMVARQTLSARTKAARPGPDPVQINQLLFTISAYNGLTDSYGHTNWNQVAARYGKAAMLEQRTSALKALTASETQSQAQAASLGVPLQISASPQALESGAAPEYVTVDATDELPAPASALDISA